jgi:hypothetical protein
MCGPSTGILLLLILIVVGLPALLIYLMAYRFVFERIRAPKTKDFLLSVPGRIVVFLAFALCFAGPWIYKIMANY